MGFCVCVFGGGGGGGGGIVWASYLEAFCVSGLPFCVPVINMNDSIKSRIRQIVYR